MKTLFFQKMGHGSPMLVLPGLLGSTDNWQSIAKQLANNYTLYLIDLRNHGRSFHSKVMTYGAMAADVWALIIEENIRNPVLIGQSMGGKVAMQFAHAYPKTLSKLIVVDIAPRAYDMTQLANILRILKKMPLRGVKTRVEVNRYLAKDIPSVLMRQYCMKNLCRDEQGMLVWSSNIPILADSIPHLEVAVNFHVPFTKPALFVKADQSDYIQAKDLPLIKTWFPNYSLEIIKDAKHWVQYHQPQALLEIITRFLH